MLKGPRWGGPIGAVVRYLNIGVRTVISCKCSLVMTPLT